MSDIKIVIGADVSAAQSRIEVLSARIEKLKDVVANTQSFDKFAKATELLKATQSEYNRVLSVAPAQVKKFTDGSNQATVALTNLGRVAQDSAFGFVGIANNLNPLLESFQRLRLETGSNKAALQALGSSLIGAGGIGIALSVVTAAVTFSQMGFSAWTRGLNENAKAAKEEASALKTVSDAIAREATDVFSLVTVLKSETETRKRKLDAIKELQQIQPDIFNGLKLEKDAVIGLDQAYQAYLKNLQDVINAKIIQAQIEKNLSRQFELQNILETAATYEKSITPLKDFSAKSLEAAKAQRELVNERIRALNIFGQNITIPQATAELDQLKKNFEGLAQKLFDVSGGIKVKSFKVKPEKIEVDGLERGLGSLFPPGKVISVPKQFSPKLVLTPSIQINTNVNSQLFTLGLFKAFLNEQALKDFQEKATTAINQTFANIINDSISTFADTIGKTLAGQGSFLPNLFEGLIKGIGDQVKELGKTLVRYGVQMIIARKAIEKLAIRPEVAVIAGFALQLLGSTLAAAANKKFNTAKFASGVRGFDGGFAMVGERGPETVFLPRGASVQPNNEVRAFGGGGIILQPSVAFDGTQFRIFLNRIDAKIGRTG